MTNDYQRQAEITALLGLRVQADVTNIQVDHKGKAMLVAFRDNRDGTPAMINVPTASGDRAADRAVVQYALGALRVARENRREPRLEA